MDRIQIKELAKRQINGQIGTLLVIYLIIYAIFLVASYIIPPLAFALAAILELSLFSIYIKLADNIPPKVADIFDIFKNARLCGNGIILYILMSVFTFLWSLLLVIPGIIKAFSYAMAPLILIENEYYMSPMDAMKESERIMEGHKMELFVLSLSFFGWCLLAALTCGLLMFYVEPYMNMSIVNFYNQIKNEPEVKFD